MARKGTKHIKAIVAAAAVAIIATGAFAVYKRHDIDRSLERASLPSPISYQEAPAVQLPISEGTTAPTPTQTKPAEITPTDVPAEINLAVPFTPQAPHANWDAPYKEFCEEASVLMAAKYLQGQDIASPEAADQEMLAIKAFEDKRFGYYEDTTAAETVVILKEYFKIEAVNLVENPSVADIKQAVAGGKLVIVPAAGRLLGNPYYTPPGPLYHMFVIKGYTKDGKFITNDPGTRRGADFLFSESTIMNAMHDWRLDRNVELGRKVIIIVG